MANHTRRSSIHSNNSSPTNAEQKFLLKIYRYHLENDGNYPEDTWLQRAMDFLHQSGVTNLKRELKKKSREENASD